MGDELRLGAADKHGRMMEMNLGKTSRYPMTPTVATNSNGSHQEMAAVDEALHTIQSRLREQQSTLEHQAETIARLEAELAEMRYERDCYLQGLYAMTRHERVEFTEEDLREHEKTGRPLREVLDEVFGEVKRQ